MPESEIRCWRCGSIAPHGARYCPVCGAALADEARQHEAQTSILGRAPLTPQPAGAGAGASAAPVAVPPGKAGSMTTVVVLLFLLLLVFLAISYWPVISNALHMHGRSSAGSGVDTGSVPDLPVLGTVGDNVTAGNTVIQVIYVSQVDHVGTLQPIYGRFIRVDTWVTNNGQTPLAVDQSSTLELLDVTAGTEHPSARVEWGTVAEIPDKLHDTYTIPPGQSAKVIGIFYFDVPTSVTKARLLVRDLTDPMPRYIGAIDLQGAGAPSSAPTTPPAPQLGPNSGR